MRHADLSLSVSLPAIIYIVANRLVRYANTEYPIPEIIDEGYEKISSRALEKMRTRIENSNVSQVLLLLTSLPTNSHSYILNVWWFVREKSDEKVCGLLGLIAPKSQIHIL